MFKHHQQRQRQRQRKKKHSLLGAVSVPVGGPVEAVQLVVEVALEAHRQDIPLPLQQRLLQVRQVELLLVLVLVLPDLEARPVKVLRGRHLQTHNHTYIKKKKGGGGKKHKKKFSVL